MNLHGSVEILSSQPIGYVGKCMDCNAIQVVVGTVASEMSLSGFKNLCQSFELMAPEAPSRLVNFPDKQKLALGTGCDHIQLCLTLKEFNQTHAMLLEAMIELLLEKELRELLA